MDKLDEIGRAVEKYLFPPLALIVQEYTYLAFPDPSKWKSAWVYYHHKPTLEEKLRHDVVNKMRDYIIQEGYMDAIDYDGLTIEHVDAYPPGTRARVKKELEEKGWRVEEYQWFSIGSTYTEWSIITKSS
jgi:hypothetical protein